MSLRNQSSRLADCAMRYHKLGRSQRKLLFSYSFYGWNHARVEQFAPSGKGNGRSWKETYYRAFSSSQGVSEKASTPNEEASKTAQSSEDFSRDEEANTSDGELGRVAELEEQIKELKNNLLRSLAEQENTRKIAKRDVEQARSFAISSFAKSLLDTSDNLSRALDAVPRDLRHDHENHPVLATLYEGIAMTDEGLTKAFAKNGLIKFGEAGEKFDPNMHDALFEYPDQSGTPGNIGQVMKVGFMLNSRVIRPAEVGVVKSP